jgi:2,5-furandicarboxylate decarboxylase 1
MDAPGPHSRPNLDLDRFRLRRFLEELAHDQPDEIDIRPQKTSLAQLAEAIDGNPRAVLLHSVGPEGAEVAANIPASRKRLAQAFGVPPGQLRAEILRRLRIAPELIELESHEAPVHEVVLTGEQADLTTLPVHLQHELDGAPYISASLDYVRDPKSGVVNSGFRRLMLRGRQETGVDLISPSDLRAIYIEASARGEKLPISFVVGCHPIDQVSGMMRLPVDELGLVSSLRAAPLAIVKGVTNGVPVPADAEMVLEGFLDPRGYLEPEGPYGEFLGYYGGVKKNPIFQLTAITRRRDALFATASISGRWLSRTDTAQLNAIRTEIMVWRALETAIREPVDVYVTPSSGGSLNVRISMRSRVPGEPRNAIAAAFGCLANVKNVFVVDPDIDLFDDEQMDWALATRFQGDRDLVILPGMRAMPIDPSLAGARLGTKTGFDLTVKHGSPGTLETILPVPPRYEGPRFDTVTAALRDGPKYFQDLMAAIGTDDGREVVRAIDALRASPGISRDAAGRYVLGTTLGGVLGTTLGGTA